MLSPKAFREAFYATRSMPSIGRQSMVDYDHIAVNERFVFDGSVAKSAENAFYFLHATFGTPELNSTMLVSLSFGFDDIIMYSNVTGMTRITNSVTSVCSVKSNEAMVVGSDYDLFSDNNGQTSFMGFRLDKNFSPLTLFKAVSYHGNKL